MSEQIPRGGMRPQDYKVFWETAQVHGWWILVRWTNSASLQYIGEEGYRPKPLDCKAKTADQDHGNYHHAGLVVDPTRVPGAFSALRLPAARRSWLDFSRSQGLLRERDSESPLITQNLGRFQALHDAAVQRHRAGVGPEFDERLPQAALALKSSGTYAVDTGSHEHPGCVTLDGDYIHGDYDLKGVIDPRSAARTEGTVELSHGQLHVTNALFERVKNSLNAAIKVPMVQHAGEELYAVHSDDMIEIFGPWGETGTIMGEQETRDFYRKVLEKRETVRLDLPAGWASRLVFSEVIGVTAGR